MSQNPKPAPDGLHSSRRGIPRAPSGISATRWTMPASAKLAGVPFIGIAAQSNPRYAELENALKENGAFAVLSDVNELPGLMKP